MWFGELITDRGIGNGMSLLIFTAHRRRASRPRARPSSTAAAAGRSPSSASSALAIVAARRLRRAGPAPHPGAVRQAHGRPQDVRRHVDLPATEDRRRPARRPGDLRIVADLHNRTLITQLDPERRRRPRHPGLVADVSSRYLPGQTQANPVYIALYFRLIVLFTYFYVFGHLQPRRTRRQDEEVRGFIPGIRGQPTADYLDFVLTR